MTTSSADRSHESIINAALARVPRERCNLPSAAAETLRASKRPDIVVRLTEGPVVVEMEVDPALLPVCCGRARPSARSPSSSPYDPTSSCNARRPSDGRPRLRRRNSRAALMAVTTCSWSSSW